jgi:hypothetical protein
MKRALLSLVAACPGLVVLVAMNLLAQTGKEKAPPLPKKKKSRMR